MDMLALALTLFIDSKILGAQRKVFVHLPPSFEKSAPTRRYPTVIVFDGEYVMKPVITTSEVLVREGQIPEAVIVAIENTDDFEGRVYDLTPPGMSVSGSDKNQGGDRFLDFIEKELIPTLDAKYRTTNPRTLVGLSSGGILTTYAAATREAFRFTLALDAPTHLGDGFLGKRLHEGVRRRLAPVRYVALSARFGWPEDEWKRIKAAAPPTWMLHHEKLSRESHNSMRFLGAYLGMRELFHDYSMLAAPEYPTTSILPAYDKLAAAYGAPMTPPQPLLDRVIDDLLMEGRGAAARAAFDTLVASYGEPRDAERKRAEIARVEKQPPPAETVEGLLATPFPAAQELGDYIGEWEGESWIHPDDKHRKVLRITAEGGVSISYPAPGVELVQQLQYLKVTKEGLTFGFMNGMRPRGMLMFEGKREGDVLSGEMRFGGINFVPPDGHTPAKYRFELRKNPRPI